MRVTRALLITLTVALLAAAAATASTAARPLPERLTRALAPVGLDGTITGAAVLDLTTGRVVYARNARRSLVPASTEKLPISLTALQVLGTGYRSRTVVLGDGEQVGTRWKGDLVLKGYGDPDLRSFDLKQLARKLKAARIEKVTGSVVGDESYFDAVRTAPGWKPSFYKLWSPPISALVVDRARLGDSVADRPALAAATIFTAILERRGIDIVGAPRTGSLRNADAPVLARDLSRQLSSLVRTMNTKSDNFIAEMLIKTVGVEVQGMGTTAAGARVVKNTLRRLGVPITGVRIKDGSGLSRTDRLTPRSLASLLRAAQMNPEIGKAFVGSLAVGGKTGTLKERLKAAPVVGRVRAKTGTTSLASALAGFVDDRYVFALMMNRGSVNSFAARAAQDRFVTILARAA